MSSAPWICPIRPCGSSTPHPKEDLTVAGPDMAHSLRAPANCRRHPPTVGSSRSSPFLRARPSLSALCYMFSECAESPLGVLVLRYLLWANLFWILRRSVGSWMCAQSSPGEYHGPSLEADPVPPVCCPWDMVPSFCREMTSRTPGGPGFACGVESVSDLLH